MSNTLLKLPATIFLLASASFCSLAQEEIKTQDAVSVEAIEAVTRLQVFLDRAEFAPGKIDGRIGQFTLDALALYREAQGGTKPLLDDKAKVENPGTLPETGDLDLSSVDPLIITYKVSEDDLKQVGEISRNIAKQAKLKALTYRSASEAIAEKFHMDEGYFEELNPGKTKSIKAGDELKVVNVLPFEKPVIEALKPGDGKAGDQAVSDENTGTEPKKEDDSALLVHINTQTNMLTVFENNKLVVAYPVTVGSDRTESPEGKWKVTKISIMPNFRYDQSMLKNGVRSGDFHMLPPVRIIRSA